MTHYENEANKEEKEAVDKVKDNPRFFFSYAKKKQNTTTNIGPLKREDGTFTDCPIEMSNILRKQYESIFSFPKVDFLDV